VAGGWRRLRNEIHNLHDSQNIFRVMESRNVRWAWHVAGIGKMRKSYMHFEWKTLREENTRKT